MEIETLPMRGRWLFRQWLWSDRDEHAFAWLAAGMLIPVKRAPLYRGTWCVRRQHRIIAKMLRFYFNRAEPTYWAMVMTLWRMGLIEFHEATMFSWQRDFSPYPWRGRRRERGI